MRKKRPRVPAFLELMQNSQRGHVPSSQYLHDDDLRRQAVDRALGELGSWRERFGNILVVIGHREGRSIVDQVDELKSQLGGNWPDLPDDHAT
jgi:hypothetical protein